jgi:hypothetical protein
MLAGSPKDLDRAIEVWQQAASGTSDSREANPDMLNRLGNALRERYNQSGNTSRGRPCPAYWAELREVCDALPSTVGEPTAVDVDPASRQVGTRVAGQE